MLNLLAMQKIIVFTFIVFVFWACKKESPIAKNTTPTPTTPVITVNPNAEANTWIHGAMNYYYLWNNTMPALSSSSLTSKPTDYFYTLLNGYGTIDRFSWIDSSVTNLQNQLNGISSSVLGIKYNIFYTDDTRTNVAFVIAYVLKGSASEKAGLKRGDIILKVDDQTINGNNYGNILQNTTVKLSLGNFQNNAFVNLDKSVLVTKTELQTNPILADTVINWAGKKVGYLAYSQFLSSFDDSLRAIFGRFKSKGVNELVLDLRYNGGGYVSSSDLLTNLIVKDLPARVNQLMNKKEFNENYTKVLMADQGLKAFETKFQNESNNLGTLNRLFVLVSNSSASASELVINNLKPFMEVILIGKNTYGKNVGSFTLTDNLKRWDFGLQPITFRTVNALGKSDYGTKDGFMPEPSNLIDDNKLPYKLLGDPNETYFNKALSLISPVAYKANGLGGIAKFSKILVLPEAISDYQKMDRKDMWIDPK